MKLIEFTKEDMTIEIEKKELNVVFNSLNEALIGIEEWEFQIRTGIEVNDARIFLKALGGISFN